MSQSPFVPTLRPRLLGHVTRKDGTLRPVYEIAGADGTRPETERPSYFDQLVARFDEQNAAAETIVNRAATENRPLTDEEAAQVVTHQDAAEALVPQIERFKKMRDTTASVTVMREQLLPAPLPAAPRVQVLEPAPTGTPAPTGGEPEQVFRSFGDATNAFIQAHRGNEGERERVQRALAIQKTSDTPGLLPVQTVGPMRGLIDAPRRIVSTATRLPLPPAGMQFRRPKVTQHTLVAKQTTEKTEVASQKMTVGFDPVDLATYAGAVNISIQDVERSDPGALELLYNDFARSYGIATEADMAAALVAAATPQKTTLLANATLQALWQAVFTAASTIVGATQGKLPDTIYASVDQWARIGGATTPINAQNGIASVVPTELTASVGNITVVVAPALPTGSLVVGRRADLEYVEDERSPIRLQVPEPRILGYEAGVYGYFAPFVADPAAFSILAP